MDSVHHGFHRKYIRLLFLFRMKTAPVFLFQDYKGDVRDCEKLQGTQTDVGGHHCALRKTQGVMAEVAAEPHPLLAAKGGTAARPCISRRPFTKAVQMGCSALGTCPDLDMELGTLFSHFLLDSSWRFFAIGDLDERWGLRALPPDPLPL